MKTLDLTWNINLGVSTRLDLFSRSPVAAPDNPSTKVGDSAASNIARTATNRGNVNVVEENATAAAKHVALPQHSNYDMSLAPSPIKTLRLDRATNFTV